MAIIKLGAFIEKISGKIGGQSISNRPQTTTIRNIVYTNKSATTLQSAQRFITASISNLWQFLTNPQRDGWEATAHNYTFINRVGQEITRNGYQVFCFCNQNLEVVNRPHLENAPEYIPVSIPAIQVLDYANGVFEIESTNATDVYIYALFAQINITVGAKAFRNKMRHVGNLTSTQLNNGIDVYPILGAYFPGIRLGSKIGLLIDPINKTTGNRHYSDDVIENSEKPFIFEVTVLAGNTVSLPLTGAGIIDVQVDYGDGFSVHVVTDADPNFQHTYSSNGTFQISIIGTFNGLDFPSSLSQDFVTDIIQFGTHTYKLLRFGGCPGLVNVTCVDTPNIIDAQAFAGGFQSTPNLVFWNNFNSWSVGVLTNLQNTFRNSGISANISSWDVSNVTNMGGICEFATGTLQMDNWDLSSLTNIQAGFRNGTSKGSKLNWVIPANTSLYQLFFNNPEFNDDLSTWDVTGVKVFWDIFEGATLFSSDLSSWDISSATDMRDFGRNANFSNSQWDNMLIAWNALAAPPQNINIAINAVHTAAANAAFNNLVATHGWTITENV